MRLSESAESLISQAYSVARRRRLSDDQSQDLAGLAWAYWVDSDASISSAIQSALRAVRRGQSLGRSRSLPVYSDTCACGQHGAESPGECPVCGTAAVLPSPLGSGRAGVVDCLDSARARRACDLIDGGPSSTLWGLRGLQSESVESDCESLADLLECA